MVTENEAKMVEKLRNEGWTEFIISKNGTYTLYDDMRGIIQTISEQDVEVYVSARKINL